MWAICPHCQIHIVTGKLVVPFAPSFVSLNILVVEKDRDLCRTFDEVLTHDGHTVQLATSLDTASDELTSGPFDVMFLNIRTVETSPEDVKAALARHQRRAPEMVLVGEFLGRPDGALPHSYGATVPLATPFGSIELRGAVARAYGPRYLEDMQSRRKKTRAVSEMIES
jgi:DNA-binding NtrC family response regulator